MKRIFLLLFALFLLFSACAPQNFPSGGEKEETQGTSFLNEKIPLSWDEGEEYFLDSVLVTLKASASHHLTRPTAEDFPGVSVTDIEYLLLGGFDSRQEYDWNYYFGGANRWRKEFRWRLRLALDCKTKDELYRACRALEELETVALVEPQAVRFAASDAKVPFEMPFFYPSDRYVSVILRHSYSDPNVEPVWRDFPEFESVGGAKTELYRPSSPPPESEEIYGFDWNMYFPEEEASFTWGITFTLKEAVSSQEEMAALCQKISERPDVLRVWPEDRANDFRGYESTLTEPGGGASALPTDSPLNQKVPFSWKEEEEYLLDSVIVTLKASANYRGGLPVADDFPGVKVQEIEYLLPGGATADEYYDWYRYYSVVDRQKNEFRWRLRLTLGCKTEDELYRACRALEELETVALVEPQAVRFADADTKTSFEMPDSLHSPNTVFVLLRHSYSDPNVEPAVQDFEELNYVIGATYRIFLPENYPDLSGKDSPLNPDVCSARQEDGAFVWGISFTLDRFIYPAKAMEDLCQRLSERPDVLKVWPAENNIHIA